MNKMFLNRKGFDAFTQTCIDWSNRTKKIKEAEGLPLTEVDDTIMLYNKPLFRLNGKDCALCSIYAAGVCMGCPLKADKSNYVQIYTNLINILTKDIKSALVSKASITAMEVWTNYLLARRKEFTCDKNDIEVPDSKGYSFERLLAESRIPEVQLNTRKE